MGRRGTYTVYQRRRREGKTDYRKRIALLKSGKPLVVVRKSNKYVYGQLALFDLKGDKIVVHAHSNELRKYGWPFALKNLPSAYLTGLLFGKRALRAGYKEGVANFGTQKFSKKGVLMAFLKGVQDSGFNINIGEEAIPSEERIRGEHIKSYFEQNRNHFKGYVTSNLDVSKLPEIFEEVKNKILNE